MAARLLLALGAMSLFGAGLATLLRYPRRFHAAEFAGLAVVLGMAGAGLLCVLLMLSGFTFGPWVLVAVAAAGAAALVARRPEFHAREPFDRLTAAGHAVTVASSLTLLVGALHTDFGGWDGEAFWTLKARSLARYGTFRTPDFTAAARPHPHPNYPLVIPSVYALIYRATGSTDGRLLRAATTVFMLASFAIVLGLLRERLPARHAAWLTAAFALVPAFARAHGGGLDPYCDYPVAVFVLLSAFAAVRWLEGEPRAGFLCAFALASLSQVKLDGTVAVFFACLLLPALAFGMRRWRGAAEAVAIVAPAALLTLVWRLTTRDYPGAIHLVPPMWSHLPETLRGLASSMTRPTEYGLVWPFFLAMLVARRPRLAHPDAFPAALLAAVLAAYVFILLSYPWGDDAREVMRHNRVRLVMHVTPLAFVWAARRLATCA